MSRSLSKISKHSSSLSLPETPKPELIPFQWMTRSHLMFATVIMIVNQTSNQNIAILSKFQMKFI